MKSVSASSLIEYLNSSPPRRNAIIKTAIFPPVFLLDRYGVMYRAARRAMSIRSIEPIRAAHKIVDKRIARNQFQKSRLANTLESLMGAEHLLSDVIATELGLAKPSPLDAFFELAELAVRVSPTSIVLRRNHAGILEIGALKLHCSKSFKLSANAAADYGALLHYYVDEKLKPMGPANPDLCMILDVYARERFTAPKNFKMRRKTITEACQEISDRWESVASRELPRTADASNTRRARH